MSGSDLARWLVVTACVFNLGGTGALLQRVGRFFLPKTWMRLLMAGNVLFMVATGLIIGSHIGHPISWLHLLLAGGAVVQVIALFGLWHWYGTPIGRAHARRIMAPEQPQVPVGDLDLVAAVAMIAALQRRVTHLAVAVLLGIAIAVFSVLVIGVITARTHSAFCTFRGDLQERVAHDTVSLENSTRYVLTHPGPLFGVPRATILADLKSRENALANQRKAVKSLSGLHC